MASASKALFREKCRAWMPVLMRDFDLTVEEAAAVFGNIGHECNGFKTFQESKPMIAGSRGGFGWCQWTGPRRRAFEAYCQRNNLDPKSDRANYGFLFVELKGSEKAAIPSVKRAVGLRKKIEAFEMAFERAGIKHYASREIWAREALAALKTLPSPSAPNTAAQSAPVEGPAMTTPNQVPIPNDRAVNPEQLAAAVRQALLLGSGALGSYLITKGYISTETWAEVIMPLLAPIGVAVGTVVWGQWARTDKNLIKSAADVPAVTSVVVNPEQPLPSRAPIVEEVPATPVADVPALSAEEIAAGYRTVTEVDLRNMTIAQAETQLPDVLRVLATLGQVAAAFTPVGGAVATAATVFKAAHDAASPDNR